MWTISLFSYVQHYKAPIYPKLRLMYICIHSLFLLSTCIFTPPNYQLCKPFIYSDKSIYQDEGGISMYNDVQKHFEAYLCNKTTR